MSTVYKSLDFLGYPAYRVGDDGSVWSCFKFCGQKGMTKGTGARWQVTNQWKRLVPKFHTKRQPYLVIGLSNGTTSQKLFVHTIVLLSFVGPCPEGMECRHLDGDMTNASLKNLCWGTLQDNWKDKIKHGTAYVGERCHLSKLTAEQVIWIRAQYHSKPWKSKRYFCLQFAPILGVSHITLNGIINGQRWKHLLE